MKTKKKNSNYKIKFETEKNQKKAAGNKFLITFVCIFLAIVLTIGIIVGVTCAVNNRNSAVKYKDVSLSEAELAFFAGYCKYDLISKYKGSGAVDTVDFWNTKYLGNLTYGELLKSNTKRYVSQVVVFNYLFDKYSRLSSNDKKEIEAAVNEIFVYRMENSEEKFNEESNLCGFSYDDYYGIVTKMYKYNKAYAAFYNANVSAISSDLEACIDYYSEYSKVKLLFINTEKDYKFDENGSRVTSNNEFVYADLSDEEKAKRLADAQIIRSAIANYGTDESGQINDAMFASYIEKYPSPYGVKDSKGFYLHEGASYTTWLGAQESDVVKAAIEMYVGEYREVKTETGVCFIYKEYLDKNDGAYLDTSADSCFLDFYDGVVGSEFEKLVVELTAEVELRESYEALDLIKHSQLNYLFIPRM